MIVLPYFVFWYLGFGMAVSLIYATQDYCAYEPSVWKNIWSYCIGVLVWPLVLSTMV